MSKKEKIFNILYWINLVFWILLIISVFWMFYYNQYYLGSYNFTYFDYLNEDCNIMCMINKIIPVFYNLLIPTIILSLIMLIVSIKLKQIKRIIIISIIIVSVPILVFFRVAANFHISEVTSYKPMIYIYPKEEMDLTIELGNNKLLKSTYPKYKDNWNIHVKEDGTIYDYNTKRNYYALFWDAKDDSKIDISEGFIVMGKDTTKFLEEKLEILGLNDREIEEFIVYWLPQMENNKYNYIRFRTTEEVNKYMPLEISKKPDTLIRIIMDFKPLNEKIKVKEQRLEPVRRSGYTIVEWGGRKLR